MPGIPTAAFGLAVIIYMSVTHWPGTASIRLSFSTSAGRGLGAHLSRLRTGLCAIRLGTVAHASGWVWSMIVQSNVRG